MRLRTTMHAFKQQIKRILTSSVALYLTWAMKKSLEEKVNVLCLVPSVMIGGAEKVVLDIARGVKSEKYHFHLLAHQGENNAWTREFLDAFERVVVLKHWPKVNDAQLYEAVIRRMITQLDIKILLISNVRQVYYLLASLKKSFPHLRSIDLLHAAHPDYIHPVALNVDTRVCISPAIKEFVIGKYREAGIDPGQQQITFIYNGNDMKTFKRHGPGGVFKTQHRIPSSSRIITYLGRFSWEKRPLYFVEIAYLIVYKYRCKDVVFVMAGDGKDMRQVKRRIYELNLHNHFILTGNIHPQKVRELLTDTYVLAMTSESEGVPLVMVEAMSMEVPVVMTDVGIQKDIIRNGENGFALAETLYIKEEMAAVLVNLLYSPEKRQYLSSHCRTAVQSRFSMETMIEKYRDLLDVVLLEEYINREMFTFG